MILLVYLAAASENPFPVRNSVIPEESVSNGPRCLDRATKDSSGMTVHLVALGLSDAVLVDSIIEVTKIYKSYKNINLT